MGGKQTLSPAANDVLTIRKVVPTKCKLPALNWAPLQPNQAKNTVFSDIDDSKIVQKLDLGPLEEFFKIGDSVDSGESASAGQHSPGSTGSSATSRPETISAVSLLDAKRLQNVAITRRKLGASADEIMAAVHRYDLGRLPPDNVDILIRIVPKEEEVAAFKEYANKNNGSYEGLGLDDLFMSQLMRIERLRHKLNIMAFMANYDEAVRLIEPSLNNLTAASKSIRKSALFHQILSIILIVGNTMNGPRKGLAYGFKLSSLESLATLRSSKDRKMTLMHVIAKIIVKDFPELLSFSHELKFAEAAGSVPMETMTADVEDIRVKFEAALAEYKHKGEDTPEPLKKFVEKAQAKTESLVANLKLAQEAFAECVEYYGDSPRNQKPESFFPRIAAFVRNFQLALEDNKKIEAQEQRQIEDTKRREEAAARRNGRTKDRQQDNLVNELNAKFMESLRGSGGAESQGKLDSSQINDGDFERIMTGLKGGYVAKDSTAGSSKRSSGTSPKPPYRRSRQANSRDSRVLSQEVDRNRV